jgi:alpha-amylase
MSVYCGGSWEGIINNLDYIQNMGFDAVRKDLYLGTH